MELCPLPLLLRQSRNQVLIVDEQILQARITVY